jgi:hypothetical protein
MPAELDDLLREGAAGPVPALDVAALQRRAGRANRRRRVAGATLSVLVVAVVAGGAVTALRAPRVGFEQGVASSIGTLERAAGPQDRLPDSALGDGQLTGGLDPDSVRLAREEDGLQIFLYRRDGRDCVLLHEVGLDRDAAACLSDLRASVDRDGLAFGLTVATDDRGTRYVGVVGDGYDTATAGERTWPIAGNVLLLDREPAVPAIVELRGTSPARHVGTGAVNGGEVVLAAGEGWELRAGGPDLRMRLLTRPPRGSGGESTASDYTRPLTLDEVSVRHLGAEPGAARLGDLSVISGPVLREAVRVIVTAEGEARDVALFDVGDAEPDRVWVLVVDRWVGVESIEAVDAQGGLVDRYTLPPSPDRPPEMPSAEPPPAPAADG